MSISYSLDPWYKSLDHSIRLVWNLHYPGAFRPPCVKTIPTSMLQCNLYMYTPHMNLVSRSQTLYLPLSCLATEANMNCSSILLKVNEVVWTSRNYYPEEYTAASWVANNHVQVPDSTDFFNITTYAHYSHHMHSLHAHSYIVYFSVFLRIALYNFLILVWFGEYILI